MAIATSTAILISAGITAAGTIASVNQQKRAARAQRQQQTLQTRRSQRQAIRETQLKQAQLRASALGAGVVGGSAIGGGLSSLSSQLGSAQGFAGQMSGLSNQISIASQKAQTYGAVADLGMSAFQGFGGFGGIGVGPSAPTQSQLLKDVG
jgi:hypothetical protein